MAMTDTIAVEMADDKRNAERAIADLDAERVKIERAERDVLLDYRGRGELPAEVIAQLDRMDAEHVSLSKRMSTQRAAIERFEAAEDDKEDAEEDKDKVDAEADKEDAEADDKADEMAAAQRALGRGADPSGGLSLAGLVKRLVGPSPAEQELRKGLSFSLTLPRPKVGGVNRKLTYDDRTGEPDGGVTGGRLTGLAADSIDLSHFGIDGVERLAISTATSGLEHPEYTAPIVNAMWDVARILDVCRIYPMTTGNALKISVRQILGQNPAGTGSGLDAATGTHPWGSINYETEGADIEEEDPTYRGVTLNDYKLARMNYESFEVIRDTEPSDIQANVIDAAGLWLGLGIGHQCAIGAGHGGTAPNGIANELMQSGNDARRSAVSKAAADGDGRLSGDRFPGISDIVQAIHNIPDGYVSMYRAQCAFMTSWVNAAGPRRLIMPNGDFFMERDPSGRTVGTLDGFPLIANPGFASWARNVKAAMVFGCWPYFAVKTVGGPRIDISWEYRFGNDQVAIRAIQEFDCDVLDPGAFYAFDTADTA